MKTLVEDEELKRLRAMADGSRPFDESGLWERLGEKEWPELKKLPARERLAPLLCPIESRHQPSQPAVVEFLQALGVQRRDSPATRDSKTN